MFKKLFFISLLAVIVSFWAVDKVSATTNLVSWQDVPAVTIYPNDINKLVFQFTLNLDNDDQLEAVALQYTGLAPQTYIKALRLWQDDGDAVFEGFARDVDLGTAVYNDGKYYWQGLQQTVASGQTNFYVTLEAGFRQDIVENKNVSFKLIEATDIDNDQEFDFQSDWGIFLASGQVGPTNTYQSLNTIQIVTSPLDISAPLAAFSNLSDGQILTEATYRLEGVAKDSGGGSVAEVKLIIDGQEFSVQTGDGYNTWYYDWSNYTPGDHLLQIKAVDIYGNVNPVADQVNVTFQDRQVSLENTVVSINQTKAKADTKDAIIITVSVKDQDNVPYANYPVSYFIQGEEPDVVDAPLASNSAGLWILTMTSQSPVTNSQVTISIDGQELASYLINFAEDLSTVPPVPGVPALAGDLIKATGSDSVYYLGNDGKRYVFPDEKTYLTWYDDFSGIVEITPEQLGLIPIGGNVTYRPGTRLVKITTAPKVYAVSAGGVLRWIQTEEVAEEIFGPDWVSLVQDVPDPFFVNYQIGEPISASFEYSPSAELARATSINVDKGL